MAESTTVIPRVIYTPTPLSGISTGLAKLFEGLDDNAGQFTRSSSCNVILPLSSKDKLSESEALLDTLATLHPSRFFVLVPDSSSDEVRAEVCARCHLIPRGDGEKPDYVCSEIVRLYSPPQKFRALAGVLRCDLLPGFTSELFLFDEKVPVELVEVASWLTDSVFFDSAQLASRPEMLQLLTGFGVHSVDLQWIGLGIWRDQIKNVFDQPSLTSSMRGIDRIEIVVGNRNEKQTDAPFVALLFAGWLVDRLALQVGSVSGNMSKGQVFDCQTSHGGTVRISVSRVSEESPLGGSAKDGHIVSVTMSGVGRGGREVQVRLERNEAIVSTYVRMDKVYRFSRTVEDETREGQLKRFFLIGESITNYAAAFRAALQMQKLRRGV